MPLVLRNGVYHVRVMINGQTLNRSTKTGDKKQAEMLEKRWVSELHTQVVVKGESGITVKRAIEEYVNARKDRAGFRAVKASLSHWLMHGEKQLHQLTPLDKSKVLNIIRARYAQSTQTTAISNFNAMINWAAGLKYSVCDKLPIEKKFKGRVRWLSLEEIEAVTAALDPSKHRMKKHARRNLDLFKVILSTGCRLNEAMDMRMKQIDLINGTITVIRSKGGTDTTFPLSPTLRQLVEARIADGVSSAEFLFPDLAGKRQGQNWLKTISTRVGITDCTPHVLRHTAAVHLLKAGLSLVEVSHILGHRDIQTTMIYAHIIPQEAAKKAADVLSYA